MRTLSFAGIILSLLFVCTLPVSANARQRHIEERLDYWTDYADDHEYYILEAEIDEIFDTGSLWFSLGPGEYHVYAEGGRNIEDLDMRVIGEDGWEIDFDTMADNFPTVSFSLRGWEDVEFELEVWDYTDWNSSGSYCFVLSRENGPGENRRDRGRGRGRGNHHGWDNDRWWDDDEWDDRDNTGRGRGRGRGNGRDDDRNNYNDRDYNRLWDNCSDEWSDWWRDWDNYRGYDTGRDIGRWERRDIVNDKLGYLFDFAEYRGHRPIFDSVEEIDDSLIYSFDLDPGYYVVFAAGGPYVDDLDLEVNWVRGYSEREIAEDVGFDAYPAVWFYIPDRTTIEIELEIYRFNGTHFEDYACLLLCRG